jgi:putative oxidoreductase
MNFLNRYADTVYSILRILIGLMFTCHGLDHAFGTFSGKPSAAGTFFFFGGWIEVITGVLVTIGLLTRPAAFVASGTMAVAYFMVHFPKSPLPILNGGDPAVLYCFIFLFAFFYGPGRLSIDSMMGRGSAATTTVP